MKPGIEWHFCNLELSKKLKDLRVKQESLYKWEFGHGEDCLLKGKPLDKCPDECSAFTAAELGEMLPMVINLNPLTDNCKAVFVSGKTVGGQWRVDYRNEKLGSPPSTVADTEADARAKMLIHLIETGVVKP